MEIHTRLSGIGTVPMLRLLADESLDTSILGGVLLRFNDIDVVRIQNVGLCPVSTILSGQRQ